MSQNLWQLFDNQGRPLAGKGATKHDAAINGLLHGAVHLWLWRRQGDDFDALFQRRQHGILAWPGRLDSSAGGHIYLGEEPHAAALRLAREEIGAELHADELCLSGVMRARLPVDDTGLIEHEYQWVYLLQTHDSPALHLEPEKVQSIEWRPLGRCLADLSDANHTETYVPRGTLYFSLLRDACGRLAAGEL